MSSNRLSNPRPYTFCMNHEGKLDVHGLNKLNEDDCAKVFRDKQSESPGIYRLNQYREVFPPGKLPSGKPGRQNVKTLENAFRWFFDTYDYTWEEVSHATVMYLQEYKDKDY